MAFVLQQFEVLEPVVEDRRRTARDAQHRERERLARKLFKKKSEKLDPRQLQLILEVLSQAPELAQDDDEPIEMVLVPTLIR